MWDVKQIGMRQIGHRPLSVVPGRILVMFVVLSREPMSSIKMIEEDHFTVERERDSQQARRVGNLHKKNKDVRGQPTP